MNLSLMFDVLCVVEFELLFVFVFKFFFVVYVKVLYLLLNRFVVNEYWVEVAEVLTVVGIIVM